MNADFKRLVEAARNYQAAPHNNDVFAQITTQVLNALRDMSIPMANAAMSVEWKADMSAVDHIRAMNNAMIDSVMNEARD